MHLQFSLSAIGADDEEDATHHLRHFMENAAGPDKEAAQIALQFIAAGQMHEAEDTIVEMLEGMPHGQHRHQ